MGAGFRISLSNCLMMVCDIPLCLSGKVKIKTVKEECVIQHNVVCFVVFCGKSNIFFAYDKQLVNFLKKKFKKYCFSKEALRDDSRALRFALGRNYKVYLQVF